jgi:hypothetical protein
MFLYSFFFFIWLFYLGEITQAIHGLVFLLAGIFSRWKQIIAYYYTPDGYDGAQLKPIIEEIIAKAESICLYVHSVTSDMGATIKQCGNLFRIFLLVNIHQFEILSFIQ